MTVTAGQGRSTVTSTAGRTAAATAARRRQAAIKAAERLRGEQLGILPDYPLLLLLGELMDEAERRKLFDK